MTSRCPFVTGSNVPGQIAMRLSGAMDSDQGVAVAALVKQRQVELERRTPVALGDDPGTGRENRSQRCRELLPERARVAIWRIEEHQIVLTSVPACPFEVCPSRHAVHVGARPRAPRGCAGSPSRGRGGVHERRLSRPARERLDRQRPRAGEQVEHPRPLHRDRGSRTAPRGPDRRSAGSTRPRGASEPVARETRRRRPSRPDRRLRLGAVGEYERVGEQRVLGFGQLGIAGHDLLGVASRPLEQLRVARQLGHPELRQPVLARADELSLAAQLEVDLGELEPVGVLGQRPQPRRVLRPRTAGRSKACAPRPIRPRSWCSCEIP